MNFDCYHFNCPPNAASVAKRWDEKEVKLLIQAYGDNHKALTKTKSGKKKVWETIFDNFINLCNKAEVKTSKTLV